MWEIPKGQIFTLIEVGKHDLFTSKGIKRCGQYEGLPLMSLPSKKQTRHCQNALH